MKPETITCENCQWHGLETEAAELRSFVDWACDQDPRQLAMLPIGECPKCRAPVYYASAHAEMVAARNDQADAERWRAFISSQRFSFMGSSNIDWTDNMAPKMKPGPLHFTINIWDVHECSDDPQGTQGRALVLAYVDELVRRRSAS